MRKILFSSKIKGIVLSLMMLIMFAVTPTLCALTANGFGIISAATNYEAKTVNYSVFIHKPTYSVEYDKKFFFIDEFDGYLKAYDTEANQFSRISDIDLSALGEIQSVTFTQKFLIIFSSLDESCQISVIDLSKAEIVGTITHENLKSGSKIHAKVVSDESDTKIAIIVKPETIVTDSPAMVIFATLPEEGEFSSTCHPLSFGDGLNSVLSKLEALLITPTADNNYYIIYVGNHSANYTKITEAQIQSGNINSFVMVSGGLDALPVLSANIMENDEKTYILVSYDGSETENQNSYTKVYQLKPEDATGTLEDTGIRFESEKGDCNEFMLVSDNGTIFPNQENQTLCKVEINFNEKSSTAIPPISNPELIINYFEEENFCYMQTISEAQILSSPWSPEPITTVPNGTDVIFLGVGQIDGTETKIEDFNYCLYTTGDKNYLGYISVDALIKKQTIPLDEYPLKVFKVIPNSNLYSLPTTVCGDQITDNLFSALVSKVRDNSRVEVLDAICGYKVDGTEMLKVKVNGTEVGYIKRTDVIEPNDKIKFVITNCSIKSDGTNIYIDPDTSSTIIYQLNSGSRVRINGARNTSTGFTYITFNDEYGNEFSGYIVTDYIVTDSWTTLQIIGLILIAINIGLLVLIIYFRNNRIGKDGQKYETSKKDNLKRD